MPVVSPPPYQLEPTSEADMMWARQLHARCYRDLIERQFGVWDEARQQGYFDAKWDPARFQKIQLQGHSVGLLSLIEAADHLFVNELQIDPDAQNRGLGTAIMRDLQARAAAAGQPLRLHALRTNRAVTLYRRLGFCETETTDTHVHMQWHPAPQWSVEPARASDLDGMLALSAALATDSTPCSFWGLTPERVDQWLSDAERVLVLARRGSDVQGIASYVRGGAYQQHLAEVSVAVAPVARRSGMAGALLSHLEDVAADAGIRLLKALIWVQNTPSRRFFEAHAYEHRATLYAEFMSEQFGEIDDCVYYKRLSPS